ncbi:hypothetical protein L6164_028397 [Bauhinia variegata]|uniref:Uncharacterized protein n=1 Tax=Bauhinia variegata TaxID=167791 RepID=A0ACB9L5A5_BAUVA|nr:hypothetical protein L6164_028397 [Bauhinia variegata]
MDPSLIGNFIQFPSAKMVWDTIATTYFDGSDTSQVYDLRHRVTNLKQAGGTLEKYYNDLQGLWREIDFHRPNPMECPNDIQHYNTLVQEDRVYVFLDRLDDRLDNIRSDVLQMKPFPTMEQAYAHVQREALRQAMMTDNTNEIHGVVLASKSLKLQTSTQPRKSCHSYCRITSFPYSSNKYSPNPRIFSLKTLLYGGLQCRPSTSHASPE